MKINNLIDTLKNKTWLRRYACYFCGDLFDLSDNGFLPSKGSKKVVIVARKYYSEGWKSYPSINIKELKALLKLQKNVASVTTQLQTYSKNNQNEGFDVKTINFDEQVIERFKRCILIPETELLAHHFINERSVAEMLTPAGALFYTKVEGKTQSAYKQGLMSSVERFCLSIGVSHTVNIKQITQAQYATVLWDTLKGFPLSKVHKIAAFDLNANLNYKALHSLYLAPLACATIFILATNGYYMYKASSLEKEQLSYQSDVNELLTKKQNIDIAKLYVEQVTNELSKYPNVHSHWDIAYQAINEGMDIQQFSGKQYDIRMRGFAMSASKVLTEVSALTQLANAEFNGAVRKSGKRDYFIMDLKLVEKNEE